MKKLLLLFFSTILLQNADAQELQRAVLVEHFTNTHCSVCATRNPGFYANLHSFPDALHIAYHPSAPYAACPLNQHNTTENDDRANYYDVYGATPRLVIGGAPLPANADYTNPMLLQPAGVSSFAITPTLNQVSNTALDLRLWVKKTDTSSLDSLVLYVAIVEDTLFFTAANGEDVHYDVFRKSAFGVPMNIAAPMAIGDSTQYSAVVPIHAGWKLNSMYAIGMLHRGDKTLVQAARSANLVPTNIPKVAAPAWHLYPNPTYGLLHIDGADADASYCLTDLSGRLVDAGLLQGSIALGEMQTGVYFLTITSGNHCVTQKLVKQ